MISLDTRPAEKLRLSTPRRASKPDHLARITPLASHDERVGEPARFQPRAGSVYAIIATSGTRPAGGFRHNGIAGPKVAPDQALRGRPHRPSTHRNGRGTCGGARRRPARRAGGGRRHDHRAGRRPRAADRRRHAGDGPSPPAGGVIRQGSERVCEAPARGTARAAGVRPGADRPLRADAGLRPSAERHIRQRRDRAARIRPRLHPLPVPLPRRFPAVRARGPAAGTRSVGREVCGRGLQGASGRRADGRPAVRRLRRAGTLRRQRQRPDHLRRGAAARHCAGATGTPCVSLHARRRRRRRSLRVTPPPIPDGRSATPAAQTRTARCRRRRRRTARRRRRS